MNIIKLYEHDCDYCIPLGQFNGHDLYYCNHQKLPTLIARYGNEGPDYISGMTFVGHNEAITEAYKRAYQKGFVVEVPI